MGKKLTVARERNDGNSRIWKVIMSSITLCMDLGNGRGRTGSRGE